jgi:DNA modification methylase
LSGDQETKDIDEIVIGERVRLDKGNIDELAKSIAQVGLVQPIVISRVNTLIAGERRMTALKRLGIKTLIHAKHYIYNDELDELKLKAMEIEENVRRKNLTWQEEILAKKRLLEILQAIHGVARPGAPSKAERAGLLEGGFGVNKLAALLGETGAATSKDLELAELIENIPQLARAETKEAARRLAALATTIAVSQIQQQAKPKDQALPDWELCEGDFRAFELEPESVDFVVTDPPYGEDVQGMGPHSPQMIAKPFADDPTSTTDLYFAMAQKAYRSLKPNKFAMFFFGFKVYDVLCDALRAAGFVVDTTPLVWAKNNVINTSPYTRYGRSYEPILVARKGEPKLVRPSQRDVIQIESVIMTGNQEQKFYHAQKPIALIEKLILDTTVAGELVVDFCAGSGTTGLAALKSKRKSILFELDPTACKIARTRLEGFKP